jgi:hypothetical protein
MAFDQAKAEESATISMEYPADVRPWQEMWALLQFNLEMIDARYDSDRPGTMPRILAVKNEALNFFITCFHFADHLWSDPAVGGRTNKQDVHAYVKANESLELAADIANSFKHHTRDGAKRLIRIRWFTTSPISAAVGWTDSNGTIHRRDVRDLAHSADDAWRAFLGSHSLWVP